jgi:hypothetical protein
MLAQQAANVVLVKANLRSKLSSPSERPELKWQYCAAKLDALLDL